MSTSPMTLTLDFQGQILKMLYLRNGMADWHGTKAMWIDRMLHPLCDFEWPLDLDLGFSRSNFENAVSQEWEGRLTWNKRDLSRQNFGPMLWLSMFTSSMTLTLYFQGQILKKSNLRNGMADWHRTKGMWVDRMLDSHCDCKLWPHPWPWPWIFKVKYWKCCNLGIGGSTHVEWKGCELDMMLDAQWDWPWVHDHGAWQLDQPSNGSMWNSYSFQPVGQWMGYSFTDLGAEGCCRSLNALLTMFPSSYHYEIFRSYYQWLK